MTNINLKDIYEDYAEDTSIFNEEDDRVAKLKHIIFNDLDEIDRRIILLYVEYQSLRKLAATLKVSTTTAYYKVKEIKQKIMDKYEKKDDDTTEHNHTD